MTTQMTDAEMVVEMPLDEAMAKARTYASDEHHKTIPSVSRTLVMEIDRLRAEIADLREGYVELYKELNISIKAFGEARAEIAGWKSKWAESHSQAMQNGAAAAFAEAKIAELRRGREGHKLVPVEPTQQMLDAAVSATLTGCERFTPAIYRAMLAASKGPSDPEAV